VAGLRDLERLLNRIDRRGYRAYREIKGRWSGDAVTVVVEHVQGDPFATPSRLRIEVPARIHGIPRDLWSTAPGKTALCDYLLRVFARAARRAPAVRGMGHSGRIVVDAGGAEILTRSGCGIDAETVELRFRVGLPAQGRTVLGRAAADLLVRHLPEAALSISRQRLDTEEATRWVELCEDHAHLQSILPENGLVTFVRDGSVLPRASGVSSKPLEGAIPFRSPGSYRVTLPTLHHGEIQGMGIPEGVTLITGGGFHGKTTLLEAIQLGVYPHVPGDGREWVVTRADTVKVRSEDGRSVVAVDLRPFIHDLPGGLDTGRFTTRDASGSTSLAAGILEALEVGARVVLLDEDTSATNLLIRDARMQALVREETITPLIDRVRELHEKVGVSTLLVVGGSGDYIDVADHVLLLESYRPREVGVEARRVAAEHPTGRAIGTPVHPLRVTSRRPRPRSFDPHRGRRERVKARGLRELVFGEEAIDLGALEQLVDDSQARAIGVLLKRVGEIAGERRALRELVERVVGEAGEGQGLRRLDPSPELALPRSFELAAAINRLRGLDMG
jgi:predicted ABC-class ATPase